MPEINEIKVQLADIRGDIKMQLAEVKGEIKSLRTEVEGIKESINVVQRLSILGAKIAEFEKKERK